jgi:hypothetical protein
VISAGAALPQDQRAIESRGQGLLTTNCSSCPCDRSYRQQHPSGSSALPHPRPALSDRGAGRGLGGRPVLGPSRHAGIPLRDRRCRRHPGLSGINPGEMPGRSTAGEVGEARSFQYCVKRRAGGYFAHFHATSLRAAPDDGIGVVHANSSPAVSDVISRFCWVPSQFGNELPSMRMVRVLSPSLIE